MPDQEFDEFGVPIKKKQQSAQAQSSGGVDEFGIPIKVKKKEQYNSPSFGVESLLQSKKPTEPTLGVPSSFNQNQEPTQDLQTLLNEGAKRKKSLYSGKPSFLGLKEVIGQDGINKMASTAQAQIEKDKADPNHIKRKETYAKKKTEAIARLNAEFAGNDDVAVSDIQRMKFDKAGQQTGDDYLLSQRTEARRNQNAIELPSSPLTESQSVNEDEIKNYKDKVLNDPTSQRVFAKRISEKYPEKKGKIQSDLYAIDATERVGDGENPYSLKKISENADKIERGELEYNPTTQQLIKPEGFFESLKTGISQRKDDLYEYKILAHASDEEAIKYLEDKRANQDPDEAIPVPKGKLAELASMAGNESENIIGGAALGALSGPLGKIASFAIPSAYTSKNYYEVGYKQGLEQAYYELVNQGVSPEEAIKKAREQAEQEGKLSAVEGLASTFFGLRMGGRMMKLVNPKTTSTIAKSVAKYFGETIKDVVPDAAIAGGLQYAKNKLAQDKGIERESGEGVYENMEGEALFGVLFGGALKGVNVSAKVGKSALYNLAKIPKSVTDVKIDEMTYQGLMSEEEAEDAKKQIDEQRKFNEQIPKNIKEESAIKIQDKIERRNELQEKIKKTDEAFHPALKEEVKKLNEEIIELSNDKEELKPDKKLANILKRGIDNKVLQGMNADVAKMAIENDPEAFFQEVAEQALNTVGDATVDEMNMKAARASYGDEIVDKAIELYDNQNKIKEINGLSELIENKKLDNKDIDNKILSLDKTSPLYDVQKERLEKERKEINNYYDSRISGKKENTEVPVQTEAASADIGAINEVVEPATQIKKIETEQDFEAELSKLFDDKTDRIVNKENTPAKNATADEYLIKGKALLSELFPEVEISTYENSSDYEAKEGRPKGSAGMFDPQANRIALNMEAIKNKGVENTIFHEVIHPVVNEAAAKNESAVSDLFDQLESMKDDEGMQAVWEHMNYYASRGGKIQKVEAVTEFLSLAADGKIDTSNLSEKTVSKIIDWINKAFELLGIKKRISTANDLKRLSDSVKKALQEGSMTDLQKVLAKSEPAKAISKLSQQKESAVLKASKPEININLDDITADAIVESKDSEGNKSKYKAIKAERQNLKQLVKCLWS